MSKSTNTNFNKNTYATDNAPLTILFIPPSGNLSMWLELLHTSLPHDDIRIFPDVGNPAAIDCALVAAKSPRGTFATLPHLRFIQSLWAGVDALLADPTIPDHVPLARLVDTNLTAAMSESVLAHVLSIHRQLNAYRLSQATRMWQPLSQPTAQERRIGILGLGILGSDIAYKLIALGFDVAGWCRQAKQRPGIKTFVGLDNLDNFLKRTNILVCLLPLTAETLGILNARTFSLLPYGATVINLARGEHVVDEDLLAALDKGQVSHAVLDVFHIEPLPTEHPYWNHPQVTVTPHIAAMTDPRTAVPQAVQNFDRFRRGQPVLHVVDRTVGY